MRDSFAAPHAGAERAEVQRHRALEACDNDAGSWPPLGRWQGASKGRVVPFDAAELDLSILWV